MSSDETLRRLYRETITGPPGSATDHPDEALWERVLCDEASEEERARLRDHALECAACADLYRSLIELRREAAAFDSGAPQPAVSAAAPVRPRWVGYTMAAGVLLVAGLTLVVWRVSRSGTPDAPLAGTTASPPAAAAALAGHPAFKLEKAPVLLSPQLALTLRGAADERKRLIDEFGDAIAPYRADDFPEAAARLRRLSDTHPTVVEPALYAGISLLLSGRPGDAVTYLERARSNATAEFIPEIDWQLALAHVHSGQPEKARDLLNRLCTAIGPHRDRACEATKALAAAGR